MKLNYYGNLAGGNKPMVSALELAVNEDTSVGTILYFDEDKRGAVKSGTSVMGVVCENYKNETDPLNHNSGKGYVKTIVSPDALYVVSGSTYKALGGNSGTFAFPIAVTGDTIADGAARFSLKLVKKYSDSTSDLNPGEYLNPTAVEGSNESVSVTMSGVSAIDTDDEFLFVPAVGFDFVTISANGVAKIDLGAEGNAVVVAVDEANGSYIVKLKNHIFA